MPTTVPRFVLCPKCRVLLQEPPPGTPFYQCGNCSTTLQAKHATSKELESSKNRFSGEQRRKSSYSDSSSGEIGSDVIADEYPLTRNGNDSSLSKKKQSATETLLESGSRGRNAIKPQGGLPQDTVSDRYPKSLQDQEQDVKQRVLGEASGPEYAQGRAAQLEIGARDHWSSSQDVSNEMSVVQGQRTEVRSLTNVTTTAEVETMSSVGQSYGTRTLTAEPRTNGSLLAGEFQQLQTSHVQRAHPDFALESMPDASHNHHPDLRRLQLHDAGAETVVGNIASGSSRKLQWKIRVADLGDEATSSGAASAKGISEDEEGVSREAMKASSVSIKETTSVEHNVHRDWKTVRSRGISIIEDRRSLDEQEDAPAGQQQLLRAPSDESDKAIDMYENSAHALDYDPSDTSSTTMDEVESNGGAGGSGRFSGEMDRQPPAVFEQGSSRPVPRPNLPRSATNSSRGSIPSEEGSSYGSPSRIEMTSPDQHLDNARVNGGPRRHSWDERTLSRMGAAGPGHTGAQQGPTSVRSKSSSQDFEGGQTDYLHRMSSVSSDSGGRLPASRTRQVPGSSMYDNYRQPSPYGLRSPQSQWVNRYVPPSQSVQQQWSPNSPHRSYFAEPSPLHPLPSRLSPSLRQISGGQLPPKQGLYPPLPPPGALPHVLCQHCGLMLAVPENLPSPNPKGTQKLRCGSCRKISRFSVPQAEGSNALQVSVSSRSDSEQSLTLLVSSPDSQAEFQSTYKTVGDSLSAGERQRSGRRYSVSDVAQKQVQAHLVRKRSLGNEDLTDADQDETVLSERVEALAINSAASSPSSFVPLTGFRSPSADVKSSQPGEIAVLSTNDHPYQKAGGGAYPRFNNFTQNANAGDSLPAEEKLSSEVSLSDSESDYAQRSLSGTSSPRFNQSNSRSPSQNNVHQDTRSSGRVAEDAANEQVHHEARGLNKTLNRIFIFRKSKQGGAVHYRRKVVVNGVPIPDHLVKKAEEQAGPIHPGTYWYDVQAGFWGVAGGQCVGIIPPFIEEFSYAMTRDCSAGRTGIFVNGRELHHMDRDKLCSRGLPDTPGMSYRIEIDGRVVEEATGSELRSLGRLAPSLEKSGRGAGMHVPPNISGGRS